LEMGNGSSWFEKKIILQKICFVPTQVASAYPKTAQNPIFLRYLYSSTPAPCDSLPSAISFPAFQVFIFSFQIPLSCLIKVFFMTWFDPPIVFLLARVIEVNVCIVIMAA